MADGEIPARAKFHAMTEGTQADWMAIGAAAAPHRGELPDRLIAHLNLLKGDDGGFAESPQKSEPPSQLPDRSPDFALTLPTSPQAALIYRLSGDYNPLHADPAVARSGGFDRPILHGLCTFGVVCRALLDMVCGNDPAKLRKMQVRFSAPVYPGETIVTELWRESGGVVSFRARVAQRDLVVINNGRAEIAA